MSWDWIERPHELPPLLPGVAHRCVKSNHRNFASLEPNRRRCRQKGNDIPTWDIASLRPYHKDLKRAMDPTNRAVFLSHLTQSIIPCFIVCHFVNYFYISSVSMY
ncbi:hypothetical protein VPH35_008010 [Triticum aestivum]